ncbi:diadenylate cyclase CdaA [Penaeicola halotolerans]|uniref:diadenylate cyclase CdaA n=1 Tax=Penaeicola halotolerans TaxID=2793196 RepID=UPI001CF80325|nr:diadenylate cyclase CdaA [Penaeicola halotolerans]
MILGFKIGFLDVGLIDIFDIVLVSFLMYQVYKLMKGSVAIKIFLGFLSLYLISLVVNAAQMQLLGGILGQFMGVGVIAVIILFQQEIRKFLLLLGKTSIFSKENIFQELIFWRKREGLYAFNITPVIEAAKNLGATNTGALIVFSRNSELKFYAESGDLIDALVSKRILLSIFNKYSPLHDGGVIIYNGRIKAARCILPVSEKDNLPAQFGLRHRAAIGMSEATDTLVLIISEETGQLSLARNGRIMHNLSTSELRDKINEYLNDREVEDDRYKSSDMLRKSVLQKEG